jgi:Serine aminopeptidase, S33
MANPKRWACTVLVAAALSTISSVGAQDPPAADPPAPGAAAKGKAGAKKGGLHAAGGALPKTKRATGVDPITNRPPNGDAPSLPEWPCHFKLKITGTDNHPLAAVYYPSQLGPNAPVVLLVHERGVGRSSKDFEDPISDIKEKSLADHLQQQDYAVLLLDLRGHGGNPRHEVSSREWQHMINDLQSAYLFLVSRHNVRELNIAKLAVIGVGDGANLAAAWVAQSGGVASEGRVSDVGSLVLVSPVEDTQGWRLTTAVGAIAPRLPIEILVGKKDNPSITAAREVQSVVERQQRSKVVLFETALHGFKLLRLFPKVIEPLDAFLKETIKIRLIDWEPRYLLDPVGVSHVELFAKSAAAPGADAAKKAAAPPPLTPLPKKKAGN